MVSSSASRSTRIDCLRAVAALLVVSQHVPIWPLLAKFGWIGVDIFFAISGFLISQLLFRDYDQTGGIHVVRFWIRRGFKIYPQFWALLAATPFLLGFAIPQREWLAEIFMVQSYFEGIWAVTWSLAIEEHFYLLLPLLFLFLIRIRSRDPFSVLPGTTFFVVAVCALLRLWRVVEMGSDLQIGPLLASHVRMDELFTGVLAGYYFRYRKAACVRILKSWQPVFGLLLPAGVAAGIWHAWAGFSIGTTLISAGAAAMVLTAVCDQSSAPGWFERKLAVVGRSSYALYLWHKPIQGLFLRATGIFPESSVLAFASYLAITIAASVALTQYFEDPILGLRDRWFTPIVRRPLDRCARLGSPVGGPQVLTQSQGQT